MPGSEANSTQNPDSMFHDDLKEHVIQETVQFDEDGDVQIENEFRPLNPNFLKVGEDGLENAVVNFLQRPVVVEEFSWLTGDLPLTSKFTLDFPGTLLSRLMIQQKIAGFRYFRADLVIRLQVNAQPFNAGRFMLWWEPFYLSQSHLPSNVKHFGGITGYRHVDLDLASSTASEIRIPYMSPLAYTDLVSGFGEMGAIHGVVYSKLTGGDDVEGTVWAHFENVCLEMPTGIPLHTYTSTRLKTQGFSDKTVGATKKPESPKKPEGKSVLPAKKDEKKKAKGDWQTMFDSQKSVAESLKGIPVIGEIATGISWLATGASFVAGLFGWSRPTNPDFETPVSVRYLRNFCNFNGNTLSKPLALDARNEIMVPSGFTGTDQDEMCFAHVLSQPVYLDRFEYNTSEAPGSLLWAWPIHPAACLTDVSDTAVNRFNTFLSFTANCFNLWRGSINYIFRVVKTPFHSGRIRLIFVPGALPGSSVSDIDFDKCYTQVVDLRDSNEFEFSIPYVSNTLWRPISSKTFFDVGDVTTGIPTGMLYVQVLNTLKAAGQADPNIEIIVETHAGDDFQFAELRLSPIVDVLEEYTPPPVLRSIPSLKVQGRFFPSNDIAGVEPNKSTTGEVVTSFRQCLKRYTQMSPKTTVATTDTTFVKLLPYSTASNDFNVTDLFSYVSHIYRNLSGSMRVLLIPIKTSTDPFYEFDLRYEENNNDSDDAFCFTVPRDFPTAIDTNAAPAGKMFDSEKFVEFDVPWYQQMPMLPTAVGLPATRSFESTETSRIPQNRGSVISIYNGVFTVNRSIGEDFSFSYLIGPPVTTSVANPDL